jgi:FAD binding domain-containing protein
MAIENVLPGRVVYPDAPAYNLSNSYWSSRQSDLKPSCFVLPTSAEDVSKALKILTSRGSLFTVKSGGHTTFPGGSSIQNGVTIDLGALDNIVVSQDRTMASIGPGLRWIDVSRALDPIGLTAVGGRSANVGVSGLILGGGISYLSGRHGLACDNVRNFQVVLASGDIVDANPAENQDLYWALRGGGGASFGIVTRFDINVFEQGDVWGKITFWPQSKTRDVLITFMGISREVLYIDKDAHLLFIIGRIDPSVPPLASTYAYHLNHLSPPDGLFDTFEGLARIPEQLKNDTVVANIAEHLGVLVGLHGHRQTWWVTTVRDGVASGIFMNKVVELYNKYADELATEGAKHGEFVVAALIIQPITSVTTDAMKRNGGNALGLEAGEFPLFIISPTVSWIAPELDKFIESKSAKFIKDVDDLARKSGFYHGFKYMNYAGKSQDVFSSYGKENHRRLREVARAYDPEGLLRKLWKGYFNVY